MQRQIEKPAEHPTANRVLSVAFCTAAEALGISQKDQARILGVSAASLSRVVRGKRELDAHSKEGELAILFVRLFRSLDALVGGDAEKARAWLHAQNHHLAGIPAELLFTIQGLIHVVEYLDAMRGRN
jgi:transcriptional regulator with XRE-family HTH domain